MNSINWKALGINPQDHQELSADLDTHNQSILAKIERFPEIIQTSRLAEKETYQTTLHDCHGLLQLITLYHDIGKLRDHFNHGEHSYNILQETDLLSSLDLSPTEQILVRQVIRHHLLIGTLFIGELSLEMLAQLDRQVENTTDRTQFYTLLVIFAVLDTWAYTDDPTYAARLLYNYDRMVRQFRQHGSNGLVADHRAWRFCCFMGAWRGLDYLDKTTMAPYEERLRKAMNCYYQSSHGDPGSQFRQLDKLNLHYAIWLLGNCCYTGMAPYYRHQAAEVQIHDGFFMLLEDMTATPEEHAEALWQVQFQGYRKPRERAQQVFDRIRSPKTLQYVLNNKRINTQNRQIVYDFSVI